MPSPPISDRASAVSSFYDELAPSYDTHLTHRIYEKLIISLLKQKIPPGKRILDIGCGTGRYLRLLRPSRGIGIDISPKMVVIAQQRASPNLSFLVGKAETIHIKETFDYILAIETIAYWQNPDAALNNIRKHCTPETRILMLSPNPFWDAGLRVLEAFRLKTADITRNLPTGQQLHALFARHGFTATVQRKIYGLQYLVVGRLTS